MMNMPRFIKTNIFTIIFTAVVLLMFAGYIFENDGEFSETENRFLAKRPNVTLSGLSDGSYMKSFELYTEEQLPFRDILIRLKAFIGELAFKNENNGIARGKEGHLFEKLVSADKQLEKNKAALNNFAGQTERDMYVCIVPNSYEILKGDIPAGFPGISQKIQTYDLYRRLGKYGNVHTISLYETLTDNADKYIYYRTDHHWTVMGAYYGYLKLCDDMGLKPLDLSENPDGYKLEARDDFYGTYYSKYRGKFGVRPDTLSYYDIPVASFETDGEKHASLYDLDKLDTYDKYAMFTYGNGGLAVVDSMPLETADRRDELIIFKDSYANCLIPFFTHDYDRIIIVDLRYYPESVKQLLDEHKEADILLIYNFMHFNEDNHFYRLTS